MILVDVFNFTNMFACGVNIEYEKLLSMEQNTHVRNSKIMVVVDTLHIKISNTLIQMYKKLWFSHYNFFTFSVTLASTQYLF